MRSANGNVFRWRSAVRVAPMMPVEVSASISPHFQATRTRRGASSGDISGVMTSRIAVCAL